MPVSLDRIAKLTTQQEFRLVRDAMAKNLKSIEKPALKKMIGVLRVHMIKARGRALAEARKGLTGDLSKRKAGIFRDALQRCEHYLLEIEVQQAHEQHVAAARRALAKKRTSTGKPIPRPASRTAGKGMASKPRAKPVARLTAGREKGHVLGTQRRAQAKRDTRQAKARQ